MADSNNTFSPVRMTAASEEAAVEQALQLIGVGRDEVSVEVLDRSTKGVTVRVGPRRDDAKETESAIQTPAATPLAVAVDLPIGDEAMQSTLSSAHQGDAATPLEEIALNADESAPLAQNGHPTLSAPPRVIDDATRERARQAAQEMLERMGMEAQANLAQEPPSPFESDESNAGARLYLEIEGEDVGILIGKHGQTLQSFQYLLNLTLNNRPADAPAESNDGVRVVVDAGGYRSRRATALHQSAQDAVERAKRDRRSVRLEPMPAHERRLVHLLLRADTSIQTGSEGREPYRHVVISPAGMRPAPRDNRDSSSGATDRGGFSGNRGRGGFSGNRGGSSGGFGGERSGGGSNPGSNRGR